MELTYEQHLELLRLANYLANVKISHSGKGNELDSMVNEFKINTSASYKTDSDQKPSQPNKKSMMSLEKRGA